ncbi:MAG: TlpA family protein disulfide reductase, partial [Polyangiaceae bacterium]|nr:TlpA family protein disulfide reductase [Polyangiaceae bacterium]
MFPRLKQRLLFSCLALLCSWALGCTRTPARLKHSDAPPSHRLVGREARDLAQLAAEKPAPASKVITLVQFWASWCASCHEDLRELEAIAAKSQGRVQTLAISLDNSESTMRKFAQVNQLSGPFYWDRKQVYAAKLNLFQLPTLILIDSEN